MTPAAATPSHKVRQNRQEVIEGAKPLIFSNHFCPFSEVYLENQVGQEGGQEGLSPAVPSRTGCHGHKTSSDITSCPSGNTVSAALLF